MTGKQDEATAALLQRSQCQTLLLQALLETAPPAACAAWDQWLDTIGDPVAHLRADTSGIRRLLPLLLVATQRNGLSVDRTFLTVLRSAYVREELRERIYRRILVQQLATLQAAGIEAILVNGAALAHSVYPETLLRHCHSVDLYCNVFHAERVAKLLATLGFRETARNRGCIGFEHGSGLPVELHQRLLGIDDNSRRFAAVYERSQRLEIDGNPVHILAPEDTLLQICAHGPGEGGIAAPWLVCDAWMQVERGPQLDRDLLRDTAESCGLANALDGMLGYLAGELGASVARHLTGPAGADKQVLRKQGIS